MKERMSALLSVLVVFASVWSQEAANKDLRSEIVIGRRMPSGDVLKAKETIFKDDISSWCFDLKDHTICLVLRGEVDEPGSWKDNGFVTSYNLNSGTILWEKQLNFCNSSYDFEDNLLFKSTKTSTALIDPHSGTEEWNANLIILLTDATKRYGVGYRSVDADEPDNQILGVDLTNGRVIWQRTVNRIFGLSECVRVNDSTGLVIANGVHTFNFRTGFGWDYDSATGKKSYSGVIATNLINFGFAALFGGEAEIVSGHDLYTDINSNVVVDHDSVFFADRAGVVKLNVLCEPLWKAKVPSGRTSKSALFSQGNNLYLFNWGFAFMNGEKVKYGNPSFSGYNKISGKMLFSKKINSYNRELLGYITNQDTLIAMSDKAIFKFNMITGEELWENSIPTDTLGKMSGFSDDNLYIKTPSGFAALKSPANYYLALNTDKEYCVLCDADLNIVSVYEPRYLYRAYFNYKNYMFLAHGDKTVVIDQNGKAIAELDLSARVMLLDNYLYEIESSSLIEFDLSQLP